MPCKKSKRKIRKHRQTYKASQPMRLIGDATKATVGLATLGIVANTVTTIAKK